MAKPGTAVQHEVRVDGETCMVWVGQKTAGTWRAYGDYRKRHIDKTGRDERDALAQWTRAAEYAANE